MKQEFFSGLLRIGNAEKAIPATARRKKSRKPLADFLLGVPLHGGGYSVVGLSVKPEFRAIPHRKVGAILPEVI